MTAEPATAVHRAPAAAGDVIGQYVGLLGDGDRPGAVRFALELLDGGRPFETVLEDVVAPAQRLVGDLWHGNRWTVAHEHRASSITETVVAALAATVPERVAAGHVVVCVADGDWHSLPARILAEVLVARGWRVSLLGVSVPADQIEGFVGESGAEAVLLTVAVPLFFGAARRIADAAHRAGVPVLAGGVAVDERRAKALGADGWAGRAGDAERILMQWRRHRPEFVEAPVDARASLLDADADVLAQRALAALARSVPAVARYDARQVAHTRADFAFIVRFLAAAQMTGDAAVMTDFVSWLAALLEARGVPGPLLEMSLAVLGDVLADDHPAAATLLAACPGTAARSDPTVGAAVLS